MFKAFRHIEDIEASDPWWKKEVLDKVGDKLKGGYFDEKNKENNNLSFGKVRRASRRAVEFCAKSRSAKKDYGFIIIERLDLEGLEDAVDRGLTASNYHEGIKQHIEFKGDVRCKPDRGTFLCKIPKLETIFAFCPIRKHKPTLDGFLVIVEYVKREQQHIQGTSYTWIHTERDFSNQWCYPLAVISYRDQKAPPPPAPKKRYSREKESAVVKSERRSRSRSPSDRRRDRSRERDRDHRDRDRYHRDKRDRSREREHRGGSHRDRDDGYRIKKERRDDDYRESRRDEDYRRRSERDSHLSRDRKEKYDQDDRRASVSSNDKRWPGENSFDGPPTYERRGSSYSQDMNSSFNNQNSGDGHPMPAGQNGFDGHQNRVPPSNGHYHGNHYPGGPTGYRPNHRMPIRPGYHGQGSYGHGHPHYNNMRMPHGNGQMQNPRGPRPGMDRSMSTPNSHVMSPDGIPTPDNFPQRAPHQRGPPNDGFTPNRGRFPSTGGFPNSPGFQGSPHSSATHISPPGPPGRPELARRHSEQFNKVPNANPNLLTVPLASPNPAQLADGRKDHFCREYVKSRLERVKAKRKAITYWSGTLAFGEDEIDASLMHYTDPDMLFISECYLRFSKLKPLLFNDLSSEMIKLQVTITKPKKSMHKSFGGMWSCYPAYIQNSPQNQENINKVFDRDTRACLSEVTTSKMIVFLVKSDQAGLRDLLNWGVVKGMMPDDSIPGFFFLIFTPLSNIKEFTQVQRANREIDLVHPNPLDRDGPGTNPTDPSYEAVQHMMGNLSMNIQHEDKYFHKDYRANWNVNHDIILQLQKMTHSQKGHHQTVQEIATRISHTRYSHIPQLLRQFIDVISEYEIFVKMDEILAEAIREEKQKRQAASDAAANPPPAPSVTVPNQNSTNLSSSTKPPKQQAAPDKPRPQLNLQPLTLPQVHSTQIPESLVPQTPPSTRVVSKQPQEKAPVPYVPSPKVRKLDRSDPKVQEIVRIEQLNKEAQLMMLLQAAAAKDNGAKLLKGLSFAEAILLIDKNNVKIHPPADPTFEEHYENCLMNILRSEELYLSKDFLEGKQLRRTRDKDYNPTVEFSIPRSVLNEKTPNVDPHKHSELKTILLNALPKMKDAPEERQKSQVRIDETRPNFTRTVNVDDPNRFSHLKKLSMANMAVMRASKNNIKRLRLGQQQIVELMEEEDDSDEDDRKGGMKTEDINKWLTDIEDCWSEIDRITDYPRFSEGPRKGEILENYLLEVNKTALEEYEMIMSMPPPEIPGEEGEDEAS